MRCEEKGCTIFYSCLNCSRDIEYSKRVHYILCRGECYAMTKLFWEYAERIPKSFSYVAILLANWITVCERTNGSLDCFLASFYNMFPVVSWKLETFDDSSIEESWELFYAMLKYEKEISDSLLRLLSIDVWMKMNRLLNLYSITFKVETSALKSIRSIVGRCAYNEIENSKEYNGIIQSIFEVMEMNDQMANNSSVAEWWGNGETTASGRGRR